MHILKKLVYKNKRVFFECFLFGKDFFLYRVRNSKNLFIDAAYKHPKDFSQILIIMYYDFQIQRKVPALYIIMNRKFESAYEEVFKAFIELIKFGDNLDFSFDTITTNNEDTINIALQKLFPNSQRILCFFHYNQLLVRKATSLGLFTTNFAIDTDILINELGILPLKYSRDNEYINNKITYLQNKFKDHYAFLDYFITVNLKYFLNNSLYYNIYPKYVRSNSILENYNMYMNDKLGDTQIVNYINILNFLKNEDEKFFKEFNIKSRNYSEIIKYKNHYKYNNNKNKHLKEIFIDDNDKYGIKWLKNSNNSCRFDIFYTIYLFSKYNYNEKNNKYNCFNEGLKILHKTIKSLIININTEDRYNFWSYANEMKID